jgi:hypothetical protein
MRFAVICCVVGLAWVLGALGAAAQVRIQSYAHPANLDPGGDNWLALKAAPSLSAPRIMKMGPDTLFMVIGRSSVWLQVRLRSGEIGWVQSAYVGCCRTAPVH